MTINRNQTASSSFLRQTASAVNSATKKRSVSVPFSDAFFRQRCVSMTRLHPEHRGTYLIRQFATRLNNGVARNNANRARESKVRSMR